jgi:DNA-binding NarL/FixJ family response regulator
MRPTRDGALWRLPAHLCSAKLSRFATSAWRSSVSSRAILPETNLSLVDRVRASTRRAGVDVEPADMAGPPLVLTPRERDVVRGILAGRSNKEMARELGLKEQGIKNVLSVLFEKCHVRNRLELALFAIRHELPEG